ncbi:MAG: hypothetical protein AAGD33_23605 [Actinomycetota bacterium]
MARPIGLLLAAATIALTACGSDGDDGSAAVTEPPPTNEGPETTEPPATNPPVTDPPATDPPVTDAPATDPPVTEAPPASESPATDAPAVEPVDITVGVPFGVVQIAALGSLADDPDLAELATVTEQAITAPDQLRTGFVAGDLDVAILPTNIAATLFTRGVDVRVLGVVDAQLLQVLGPAGSGWAELDGVVDIPFQGDAADLIFRQLAEENGVDVDGLQIRYGTALPDLVGAAAGGNVTAAVLPEHFATAASAQASAAGHDLVPIIDLQRAWSEATGGDRLPQIAVVAVGSLVDDRPDLVDAIRSATANAVTDVVDDPGAAAIALAEETGLPEPLIGGLLPRLDLAARSTSEARADLDLFLAGLFAANPEAVGGALPEEAFFAA